MLLAAPVVTLAVIGLVAPGILWALYCYPAGSYTTRVVVGVALGLAFQWHLCALLAAGPGITPITIALTTGGGLLLAGALAWRHRTRFPIRHRARPAARHTARHTAAMLAAILGVSTAIGAIPLAVHTIPQGWDPSFHVLLASTTVATGHLPTWAPYEQIPLNYPYGPHVFLAEVSLVTGIAPDQVFGVLLNLLAPLATGLALYAFARQVWRSDAAALGAVAAYALLGNWGSLDYGRWGGLPNALGCFLLLAFVLVFCARGHAWTRILVGGLLLGAIPLAHHHVALTTALLLVGYGVGLGVVALRWQRQAAGHTALRQVRQLSAMAVVALVSVAYYAVPYALRARDVQSSDVLRYFDHSPGLVFDKNGVLLWILALAGSGMLVSGGMRRYWLKQMPRPQRMVALAFTIVATVLLLLAFVLGYYGYRTYSLWRYQQPYTAFTPTRFLTDLTYFLAILAGPPLAWLWQCVGSIRGWRSFRPTTARALLRTGLALVLVITACVTLLSQLAPDEGHLQVGEAEAFSWIQRHTPQNTIVVNLDPSNRWAPYFTRREVTMTPVPVSEFTTGYVADKRYLADVLLGLLHHERLLAFAADSTAFPALAARPVALLSDAPLPSSWDTALRFRNGPEHVYLLGNAFGRLLTPTDSARWWHGQQPPPGDWQTSADTPGWGAQPPSLPSASGALYLQLTVAGGASLQVNCGAQQGGQVFIDGKHVPDTCAGSWQTFPELAAPGKHLLAFRATFGRELDPWFSVAVVTGSTL